MVEEEMMQSNHGRCSKKRRKGSASSIQKPHLSTTSKPNPDLISTLPDSLLLHILSHLNMEYVMETSLVSRRWRYLWKSIPGLCFQPLRFFLRTEFSKFIDRCLFHHEGSKIQKLHIVFDYLEEDEPALLVDSWIHFAITCKVEDFKLHIYGGGGSSDDYIFDEYYRLPRSLYSCTTLTSLTLCGCNLNLPDSFQLSSLKKLTLQRLELSSDSIERFSSNCPLLEDIYLLQISNWETDLNIVIKNEQVKRLEISNNGCWTSSTVKINAPTLLSLRIYQCDPSVRFHVEELGSLMSADVIGKQGLPISYKDACPETGRNYLEELLYNLRHVKRLKLCSCCIQVLSFTKVQSSDILPISATCLELNASLTKWELPGIRYLLESCSNLENLKINLQLEASFYTQLLDELMDTYDFEVEGYWESVAIDFPSILQKIKIIKINGYDYRNEAFIRFLLKNSKVLETMAISTPKRYFNNFEKLFELTKRLLVFPRSSPIAEVFIT